MDGMIKSCHDENGWVEGTGEGLRRAGMRQGVGVASTGVQRSSAKSATHSVLPSLDHGSHSLASPHGLHVEYGGGPLVRGGMRGHGMDGMIKSCHDEEGWVEGTGEELRRAGMGQGVDAASTGAPASLPQNPPHTPSCHDLIMASIPLPIRTVFTSSRAEKNLSGSG